MKYTKYKLSNIKIYSTAFILLLFGLLILPIGFLFIFISIAMFSIVDYVEINLLKNEIFIGFKILGINVGTRNKLYEIENIYVMPYEEKSGYSFANGMTMGKLAAIKYGLFLKDNNGMKYEIDTFRSQEKAETELKVLLEKLNMISDNQDYITNKEV